MTKTPLTPEQKQEFAHDAILNLLDLLNTEILEYSKTYANYFVELVEKNDTEKLKEVALAFAEGIKRDQDLHDITAEILSIGNPSSSFKFLFHADGELYDKITNRHFNTYFAHVY